MCLKTAHGTFLRLSELRVDGAASSLQEATTFYLEAFGVPSAKTVMSIINNRRVPQFLLERNGEKEKREAKENEALFSMRLQFRGEEAEEEAEERKAEMKKDQDEEAVECKLYLASGAQIQIDGKNRMMQVTHQLLPYMDV